MATVRILLLCSREFPTTPGARCLERCIYRLSSDVDSTATVSKGQFFCGRPSCAPFPTTFCTNMGSCLSSRETDCLFGTRGVCVTTLLSLGHAQCPEAVGLRPVADVSPHYRAGSRVGARLMHMLL